MGSRGCRVPPEGRGWGPAKSPYGGGSAGGPAVAWCSGSVVIVTGGTKYCGESCRLSRKQKVCFKGVRYLLLKNPWNLTVDQKERLSTLVKWNTPITRAYYLKESFQLFFEYKQPTRAREHLERWMHSAMRSRLEPFKSFVRLLRGHLDGVLAWTKLRLSNGALEGMNNKIKLVSHRAFGFRSVEHYVAAIYHCCAQLPLPQRS